jgi:hypothetical protein
MVGREGRTEVEGRPEIADTALASSQVLDDSGPRGLGDGSEAFEDVGR